MPQIVSFLDLSRIITICLHTKPDYNTLNYDKFPVIKLTLLCLYRYVKKQQFAFTFPHFWPRPAYHVRHKQVGFIPACWLIIYDEFSHSRKMRCFGAVELRLYILHRQNLWDSHIFRVTEKHSRTRLVA